MMGLLFTDYKQQYGLNPVRCLFRWRHLSSYDRAHARDGSAASIRPSFARKRLFGEVRMMVPVTMAVMSGGLLEVQSGGTGRRRDGHHGRHSEKKNCQESRFHDYSS